MDNIDKLIDQQAEQIAKEDNSKTAKEKLLGLADYIRSAKFKFDCKKAGLKHGVKGEIVKNAFLKNILSKIAGVLGLTVNFIGDLIQVGVKLISYVICKITSTANDILLKLINVLTFNCGSII